MHSGVIDVAMYEMLLRAEVVIADTVVYLSPHAAASKWVEWEINQSLAAGKKVLGVYSGKVQPAAAFPAISKNGITCVSWSQLATAIENLNS